ncbi:monocarboxylate transporter 12-like [Dermacentor andersoni]|uniref:monocarboxylate transporter 12-like n=1 Tax=Dermacentor andersoni TaxID=34620 RepID=UPI0021553507|nr:monocarboxylate transporter 12-like [Dermacentor andersoni]
MRMPPPKERPSTMASHYVISEQPPEFPYNGYGTEKSVDHFSARASRNNTKGQGELPTTTDKCWGVPLSLSGAAFLVGMPWAWFGLLLVFFVEKFGITREEASWPKSVATTITNISGLGVYGLQRYLNTYHVVLLSTILTSVAFVCAAFAPNMTWMTVTVGAMHGFGHGTFLTASAIYTLQHFDKYRSVATSFIFISYGLSAIVSQFVLSGLVDAYALQGALLVFGAMVLNSTALVMLAKTPTPMRLGWTRSTVHLPQNGVHKPGHYGSTSNDNSTCQIRNQQKQRPQPTTKLRLEESASLKDVMTIFTMPSFYVLLGAILVGDFTTVEVFGTIVDYSLDKGIAVQTAKHMITLSAIGQVAGRTVAPLVADCMPWTRRPLYSISFAVVSVGLIAMPHVSSFAPLVSLSSLVGVSQGYILCIRYVLTAEFVGVQRTAACSGIIGIVMVPAYLVSPKLVGIFRDASGSYDNYYRMLGALSLAAAVLFATYDACSRVPTERTKPAKDEGDLRYNR